MNKTQEQLEKELAKRKFQKKFRKSLKKMMKELGKFKMDDQAKMIFMLNAYCRADLQNEIIRGRCLGRL